MVISIHVQSSYMRLHHIVRPDRRTAPAYFTGSDTSLFLLLSGYTPATLYLDAHARLVQAIQHVQLFQCLRPKVVDRLAVVVHLQTMDRSSSCTVRRMQLSSNMALVMDDTKRSPTLQGPVKGLHDYACQNPEQHHNPKQVYCHSMHPGSSHQCLASR